MTMRLRVLGFMLVGVVSALGAFEAEGLASWYGGKFQGRLTASGEIFDTNELTAAHRTLPFQSIVRVTNKLNEKSVVVRINDRGPFIDDRIIDLSRAAADIIGLTAVGVAPVKIEVLHEQLATSLRTVQVAAFSERQNAVATFEELMDAGLSPAIVSDIGNPARPIHRVIIQGVDERDLGEVIARLSALGYPDVLVRRK